MPMPKYREPDGYHTTLEHDVVYWVEPAGRRTIMIGQGFLVSDLAPVDFPEMVLFEISWGAQRHQLHQHQREVEEEPLAAARYYVLGRDGAVLKVPRIPNVYYDVGSAGMICVDGPTALQATRGALHPTDVLWRTTWYPFLFESRRLPWDRQFSFYQSGEDGGAAWTSPQHFMERLTTIGT